MLVVLLLWVLRSLVVGHVRRSTLWVSELLPGFHDLGSIRRILLLIFSMTTRGNLIEEAIAANQLLRLSSESDLFDLLLVNSSLSHFLSDHRGLWLEVGCLE